MLLASNDHHWCRILIICVTPWLSPVQVMNTAENATQAYDQDSKKFHFNSFLLDCSIFLQMPMLKAVPLFAYAPPHKGYSVLDGKWPKWKCACFQQKAVLWKPRMTLWSIWTILVRDGTVWWGRRRVFVCRMHQVLVTILVEKKILNVICNGKEDEWVENLEQEKKKCGWNMQAVGSEKKQDFFCFSAILVLSWVAYRS